MTATYIFDKVTEIKEKFKNFFNHKKKLAALKNFAQVAPFRHRNYLVLIEKCLDDGFLEDKDADYLGYLIGRYEVNYLDWSMKTRWLRAQLGIPLNKVTRPRPQQMTIFDFDKKKPAPAVPLEILAAQQNASYSRRV